MNRPENEPARAGRWRLWLPWSLVLLQLAWWSYGAWPFVPLEGDEQGVLFGLAGMQQHDPVLLQARYLYEVQPGSYHLLLLLARLVPASNETLFAVATITGAAGFALAGARLLQLLLPWPFAWLLAAMLWCQETTAAAYYMNTSAFAGGLAIAGVILAHSRHRLAWLGAGLTLAMAGWLRADSLLVAPACLGLAYWAERRWWPALGRTAAIAVTALAAISLLHMASGTGLLSAAGTYAQRGYALSGARTFLETSVGLLSPLLALAALAGLWRLVAQRQYALGLIVVSGTAASLLAYGSTLTTPKYFYYLVPFALIPALHFIGSLVQQARRLPAPRMTLLGAALAVAIVADGVLGLRTLAAEQRLFTTAPTWATFWQGGVRGKTLALVAGPGELVINADGFRLRTGQLFAPWCWHREKRHMQDQLATVRTWLADRRDLTIYWSSWLPYQMVTREMFAAGFRPMERFDTNDGLFYHGRWRRHDQAARVDFLGYVGSRFQKAGPAPAGTVGEIAYFVGDGARQPITELADGCHWQFVSSPPEGFITLHRRL